MQRVLIVDAEPTFQQRLAGFLEQDGYQVQTASDGPSALELARAFDPDVLIADAIAQHTPAGDNLTVTLRRLKPELAAVVITPLAGDDGPLRTPTNQSIVLERPFDADALRHALQCANSQARGLGACIDCGIALPLLRPRPTDVPRSWSCAFCNARYLAVFDAYCPDEVRGNARPIQGG